MSTITSLVLAKLSDLGWKASIVEPLSLPEHSVQGKTFLPPEYEIKALVVSETSDDVVAQDLVNQITEVARCFPEVGAQLYSTIREVKVTQQPEGKEAAMYFSLISVKESK